MAKLVRIIVFVFLFLSLVANADEQRDSWNKKSFKLALNELINKAENINTIDVLAWYVSSVKNKQIGESAAVLLETNNKLGNKIYYLAILHMSLRNTQPNEWSVVWVHHDKVPRKSKRLLKKPSNEDIYSLFDEAGWNWGCNNTSIEVKGKVRNRVWEDRIGEKPTMDFIGEKELVCNQL